MGIYLEYLKCLQASTLELTFMFDFNKYHYINDNISLIPNRLLVFVDELKITYEVEF